MTNKKGKCYISIALFQTFLNELASYELAALIAGNFLQKFKGLGNFIRWEIVKSKFDKFF